MESLTSSVAILGGTNQTIESLASLPAFSETHTKRTAFLVILETKLAYPLNRTKRMEFLISFVAFLDNQTSRNKTNHSQRN
jgi:hypothetical protein